MNTQTNKNQIKLAGGTTGQGLVKISNADYDYDWGTIMGGGGGSGGTKLAIDTTEVTVGNTAVETTLFTVAVPGGTLGTNDAIRYNIAITGAGMVNTNGQTLTLRVKYGVTTLNTVVINDPETQFTGIGGNLCGYIIADGATNAQKASAQIALTNNYGETITDTTVGITKMQGFDHATGAEDSTLTKNLVITAQWSAADVVNTITSESIIVEKISSSGSSKFVGAGDAVAKTYFNIQLPFTITGESTDNMWASSGVGTIQSYAQWSTSGNGDGVYLDTLFGGFPAFLPTSNAEFRQFDLAKIIIAETVAYIDPTEVSASFLGFTVLGSSTHPDVASNTLSIGFVRDAGGNWYIRSATGAAHTDTAISAPANTAHTFRIEYDPAATEARFFIDGSSVGTVTTNLPTASTSVIGFMMRNDTSNSFEYGMAPSFALEI